MKSPQILSFFISNEPFKKLKIVNQISQKTFLFFKNEDKQSIPHSSCHIL